MRTRVAKASLLALVILLLLPSTAQAGVVRWGSTVVEVGWPGTYFLSQTEREFVSEGCPNPSTLEKKDLDAAIIDVDPGSYLKLIMKDPAGSMNMAFYDDDCDLRVGFYGGIWSGRDSAVGKRIESEVEWAVITFNYGYDIAFDWKVCSPNC